MTAVDRWENKHFFCNLFFSKNLIQFLKFNIKNKWSFRPPINSSEGTAPSIAPHLVNPKRILFTMDSLPRVSQIEVMTASKSDVWSEFNLPCPYRRACRLISFRYWRSELICFASAGAVLAPPICHFPYPIVWIFENVDNPGSHLVFSGIKLTTHRLRCAFVSWVCRTPSRRLRRCFATWSLRWRASRSRRTRCKWCWDVTWSENT